MVLVVLFSEGQIFGLYYFAGMKCPFVITNKKVEPKLELFLGT